MESDFLSYQQQGATTEDLVAGLSYSIVANYLNRVVGRRKIGDNICFQGGTAFNKAVWAAFEKVTGKPIMVPDHHECTGALGAAAIAAEHIEQATQDGGVRPESKFKGFENLVNADYTVESFACDHCSNHCEIKKVQLALTRRMGWSVPNRYFTARDATGITSRKPFKRRADLGLSNTVKANCSNSQDSKRRRTEDGRQRTEDRRQRTEKQKLVLELASRWRWRRGSYCPHFHNFSGSWDLRLCCPAGLERDNSQGRGIGNGPAMLSDKSCLWAHRGANRKRRGLYIPAEHSFDNRQLPGKQAQSFLPVYPVVPVPSTKRIRR